MGCWCGVECGLLHMSAGSMWAGIAVRLTPGEMVECRKGSQEGPLGKRLQGESLNGRAGFDKTGVEAIESLCFSSSAVLSIANF